MIKLIQSYDCPICDNGSQCILNPKTSHYTCEECESYWNSYGKRVYHTIDYMQKLEYKQYLKDKESDHQMEKIKVESREFDRDVRELLNNIGDLLIEKNHKYGNSVLEPVRVFSKASPLEQIKVRIDDKISRLVKGDNILEDDEDVVDDLIGYLVIYKLAKGKNE